MAFRRIEEIHIGTNPPGEAFGGYIYDFKVSFGFNGSPTTCSVNIVNEDGIYNINQSRDLTTLSPVSIWVEEFGGGSKPFLYLLSMHLVEFSVQKTADAKVLSLEYVDHSIILDKIWVGLANKSAKTHNLAMPPFAGPVINQYRYLPRVIDVPIKCHPCTKFPMRDPKTGRIRSTPVRDNLLPPTVEMKRVTYMAGGGFVSNVHMQKGGAILIGTQEFANSQCNIKEVSYSWNELAAALYANGIFIENWRGLPSINNRGKPHYRQKHADKSLKDVLNAWCQDMGFDWTWDPGTNKIWGRDLNAQNAIDLTPIWKRVENWSSFADEGSGSKSIITNLNHSSSIKNTKRQDHISGYRKPARIRDYSEARYTRVISKNVRVENVIPEEQFGMKRTLKEFMISCSLAKFSREAREIYLVGLAEKKFGVVDGNQPDGMAGLEPLGIENAYRFSEAEKVGINNLFHGPGQMDPAQVNDPLASRFAKTWKNKNQKFDLYLGTYNQKTKSAWEAWEAQIADFFGDFYTNKKEHKNFSSCLPTKDMQLTITNHPVGGNVNGKDVFKVTSMIDLPFGHIMRGAPCPDLNECAAFGAENTFNVSRTCWDHGFIGAEALGGGQALNPNNDCCGYVLGIPQGTALIRGRTYRFSQSDPSWKESFRCLNWLHFTNPDGCDCTPMKGGKLLVKNEDGGNAPGYNYTGKPGVDGAAIITIPSEGDDGERLYLTQEVGKMIAMGCGGTSCLGTPITPREGTKRFAFRDGLNALGAEWSERYMVLGKDPDADEAQEMFVFKRGANWGIRDKDMSSTLNNDHGTNVLQKLLPTKEEIPAQMLNNFMTAFDRPPAGVPVSFGEKLLTTALGDKLRQMVDLQKVYLIWMPKKRAITTEMSVSDLRDPIVDGKKTVNPNETVFGKDKKEEGDSTCRTICEFDFISRVCRCWPGRDFDVAPEVNGLSSNAAYSFNLSVRHPPTYKKKPNGEIDRWNNGDPKIDEPPFWKTIKVILPSMEEFYGYHKYDIKYREILRHINATAGMLYGGGDTMGYSVNTTDITQDMDDLNPDPVETSQPPKKPEAGVAGAGAGLPGWEGGGKIVANLIVPKAATNFYAQGYHLVPMEAYHKDLDEKFNINYWWPAQSLDFTVVGGHVAPLAPFISPQWGLESLSVSYGSQGLQTSFRYATRYPSPVPDQMAFQKISPHINLNIFGRTF